MRPDFFNSLTNPTTPGSHIIGGDFNCVLDANMDTIGDPGLATTGTPELITWAASLDALDAWRIRNTDSREYTSPSGNSRIDIIFLSGCFTNHFNAKHSPRTIGSDHMAPLADLKSCNITTGKGHWQLPTWLSHQAAASIKPVLESLAKSTDDPNYAERFTNTMKEISGKCKAVHKRVLRWRKDKVERARLRWIRAHYRAIATPSMTTLADAEETRQTWIKAAEDASNLKRARAFDKHFAEAERCTAFFLRRPKRKNVSMIPGVQTTNGEISHEPTIIQSEHNKFWTRLYSVDSNGTDPQLTDENIQNLTNTPLPRLSDVDAATLEQPVSEEDIVNQINRLPNNKAAGTDGLRAELLKHNPKLWAKILRPIFDDLLHHNGSLPQSFRESVIILLHKKGCALQPKNYRPIALLNVTAKVLSGIHNDRLRKVIGKVIPPEQTGFIPRRSISENILLLQDSIYYAKRHHPSAIILSLDFEKAYDRVQWRAMKAVLEKLNFGPKWRKIINTMYTQRSASLSINGTLSDPFPIERGVLQGDPLSPSLFILQCSPLYAELKKMQPRHGIPLPDNNTAPVATYYADDTNLIARSPESAVALYNTANRFCANSGAKIHPNKCTAIPTGPSPPQLSNGISVLSPHEDTTILGVPMGMSITRQQQTHRVIAKMISRCNDMTHIGRTIEGRINIARAMILSTLWFVLGALPTNASEAKKIQNMIYNFINGREDYVWDGPTARGNIARQWFHGRKGEGGWNMAPVVRTLKARKLSLLRSFMRDSENGTHKPWHTFIKYMLCEHMQGWCRNWKDILMWKGVQKQGDFAIGRWDAISPWWREAWQEWLKLNCTPARNSFSRSALQRWPVWNNRLLARNHGVNTALYKVYTNSTTRSHMREFRQQGFLEFRDFMNSNGTIMSGQQLYTSVTVHLSVNDSEHVILLSACVSLSRFLNALWRNTMKNWLKLSAHTSHHDKTKWAPAAAANMSFTSASNAVITKLVSLAEPAARQPKLITFQNQQVCMNWARETRCLKQLAPTRRDLSRRLIRNALPLGHKRIHWTIQCQRTCLLCDTNTVEAAQHLFWECRYAKIVWNRLHRPWKTHTASDVGWREALTGYEVRAGPVDITVAEQIWAIVRSCIMRTIWLERNRRYFYPELPVKSASFRHHQAKADIQAHIRAWQRRDKEENNAGLDNAITFLALREPSYSFIHRDLQPPPVVTGNNPIGIDTTP